MPDQLDIDQRGGGCIRIRTHPSDHTADLHALSGNMAVLDGKIFQISLHDPAEESPGIIPSRDIQPVGCDVGKFSNLGCISDQTTGIIHSLRVQRHIVHRDIVNLITVMVGDDSHL